MGQISFKIPDEEMEFLRWFSTKTANSISTLYRDATIDSYRNWKLDLLCSLYEKGSIGFKQFCRLGNLTFQEGMLLIESRDIEPPISETINDYTDRVTRQILEKLMNRK